MVDFLREVVGELELFVVTGLLTIGEILLVTGLGELLEMT